MKHKKLTFPERKLLSLWKKENVEEFVDDASNTQKVTQNADDYKTLIAVTIV